MSNKYVVSKLKVIVEKWPNTLLHESDVHGMPIHDACQSSELEVIDHLTKINPQVLDCEHPKVGLLLACVRFDRHDLFLDLIKQRYDNKTMRETPLFCALNDK